MVSTKVATDAAVDAMTDGIDSLSIPTVNYLTVEEGKDYLIEDGALLPYQQIKKLGHGSSGTVEKVRDRITGTFFARKTFLIPTARHQKAQSRVFGNELEAIRNLGAHLHIVSVFATYTTKEELGLILRPVAEADLATVLVTFVEAKHDSKYSYLKAVLEQSFGCLLSALAFMHEKRVRHKDIKPQNILVHNGIIVYTDFGSSLLSGPSENSSSEGHPGGVTWRYSAPEVTAQTRRNSKSDVYSLGCVFIEILLALTRGILCNKVGSFSKEMDQLHNQIEEAYIPFPLKLKLLPAIIKSMTQRLAENRPTADDLCCDILCLSVFGCSRCQSQLDVHRKARDDREKEAEAGKRADVTKKVEAAKEVQTTRLSNISAVDKRQTSSLRGVALSTVETRDPPMRAATLVDNMASSSRSRRARKENAHQNYQQHSGQQSQSYYSQYSPIPVQGYNQSDRQSVSQYERYSQNDQAQNLQIATWYPSQYAHQHAQEHDSAQPAEAEGYAAYEARYRSSDRTRSAHNSERAINRAQRDEEPDGRGSWAWTAAGELVRTVAIGGAIMTFDALKSRYSSNSTPTSDQSGEPSGKLESPNIPANSATSKPATKSNALGVSSTRSMVSTTSTSSQTSPLQTTSSPYPTPSPYPTSFSHNTTSPYNTISPSVSSNNISQLSDETSITSPNVSGDMDATQVGKWIWSPQHGDYYCVEHTVTGATKYIWYKETLKPRPDPLLRGSNRRRKAKVSWIRGLYDWATGSSPTNLHYEAIDPSYHVRDRSFFSVGKVFAVLFEQPANAPPLGSDSSISLVRYTADQVHQIRRFVVVKQNRQYCYACPLLTYGGCATTKRGVRPHEHAIAYSWGLKPQLLPNETGLTKACIGVVMVADVPPLHVSSRIHFGRHFFVEHNVKAKDIGYVPESCVESLLEAWKEEASKELGEAHIDAGGGGGTYLAYDHDDEN